MNKNNIAFESGQYYTLSQLFSGNNKIVIPDLQRDYCWGNPQKGLVSDFVQNLIDLYKENSDGEQTLGLICGYEQPKRHIQLCDGQQRMTTLFLLLGMLNRRTNNIFQKRLISRVELDNDDKEPYLQYAIRESTLYFLSDLVCEFFLKSDICPEKINSQDWYFAEYDLDASIQSMLAAIKTINVMVGENIDCVGLGNFILEKLQLLYYDMVDRTHGEETFVIINTTGEPLTATENLKPILLGNISDEQERNQWSKEWEEREDWFWQNRTTSEEKTADKCVNDFFDWLLRLLQEQSYKNHQKPKLLNLKELLKRQKIDDEQEESPRTENWEETPTLNTVHSYFQALSKLIDLCKDEKAGKVLKTLESGGELGDLTWFRKKDLHVVLPLIVYLEKFKDPVLFYEFVHRIRKNYFDKKRERGNFVDWRYIIQIIKFSEKEKDVLCFETKNSEHKFNKIPKVDLNEWYNDDEKKKDILKKDYKEDIELWEENPDLMGDLTPLWKANEDNENSFENMNRIWKNFELFYNCYNEEKSKANPELSNWVRLYRVLIEEKRIGHIDYTSGMKGAWFSWSNKNNNGYFHYLTKSGFLPLLKIEKDKLLHEIQNRVRNIIPKSKIEELNDGNFSAEEHLKIWLLLKVLNAKDKLLAFWEGNGLASYDDCKKNKLNEDLPFSLGNSICGYAVKSPSNQIRYATSESWWLNQEDVIAFDVSIGEILSLGEFSEREQTAIPKEKIEAIDKKIQKLLDEFY
jgi:hypothetical protein